MISGNTCIVGTVGDVNCQTLNGNLCTQCYTGYYVGKNGNCLQINPLCRTVNQANGACTSCYSGYEINGGNCVPAVSKDKNCKRFDNNNSGNYCQECYKGFVAINGKCSVQNPLCKTIDITNGACTTCWPGYAFNGNNC